MKRCGYCGRENPDNGTQCVECGATLAAPPKSDSYVGSRCERIAQVEHEIEAERLDTELSSRNIPHVMVSYGDSAFNGIFQTTRGWGHVEAAAEHREVILEILKDLRQEDSGAEPDVPHAPDQDQTG